jgi:hypothetical protein
MWAGISRPFVAGDENAALRCVDWDQTMICDRKRHGLATGEKFRFLRSDWLSLVEVSATVCVMQNLGAGAGCNVAALALVIRNGHPGHRWPVY